MADCSGTVVSDSFIVCELITSFSASVRAHACYTDALVKQSYELCELATDTEYPTRISAPRGFDSVPLN